MPRSEILYLLLFIGVFPALWILAAVLDRFLPTDSSLYSPQDERKRQSELDELFTARPGKPPSGRESTKQASQPSIAVSTAGEIARIVRELFSKDRRVERNKAKAGQKERADSFRRSKSQEAYRARAAAALVAAVR